MNTWGQVIRCRAGVTVVMRWSEICIILFSQVRSSLDSESVNEILLKNLRLNTLPNPPVPVPFCSPLHPCTQTDLAVATFSFIHCLHHSPPCLAHSLLRPKIPATPCLVCPWPRPSRLSPCHTREEDLPGSLRARQCLFAGSVPQSGAAPARGQRWLRRYLLKEAVNISHCTSTNFLITSRQKPTLWHDKTLLKKKMVFSAVCLLYFIA